MNIYPYVYRVDHPSGEFYIGYRCANKVPASQDFGIKYKTSSKHLSYPFEEYSLTVVAEFYLPTAKADAYDFEQALIFEHWGNPLMVNQSCNFGRKQWRNAGGYKRDPISDSHRQNLSASHIGHVHSDATKRKMSAKRKGRRLTDAHKQKLAASAKTGIPLSNEHRQNLSAVLKGRIHINNGVQRKFLLPADADAYLQEGWQLGRQLSSKA